MELMFFKALFTMCFGLIGILGIRFSIMIYKIYKMCEDNDKEYSILDNKKLF